jgi:integrase
MRAYGRAGSVVRIILRLAFELALRRGEIARIHRNDIVDMGGGPAVWIHGKGGKSRLIPLPVDLAREITRLSACRGGWLLPGDIDGHMSAERVGKIASSVMEAPWTLHTLRHACATGMLAQGENLRVIQEVLGHASVATTQIYTAVTDQSIRAALEHRAELRAS